MTPYRTHIWVNVGSSFVALTWDNFARNSQDISLWYQFVNRYWSSQPPRCQQFHGNWVMLHSEWNKTLHYNDVIMGVIAFKHQPREFLLNRLFGADQRKHQNSASLAFVHRRAVNYPHKGPVTRKMFPFGDVIMGYKHVIWGKRKGRVPFWWHDLFDIRTCSTHWDRVTHSCASKLTFIASDNGLSPGRRQAIIWTNSAMLLIGILGTNYR